MDPEDRERRDGLLDSVEEAASNKKAKTSKDSKEHQQQNYDDLMAKTFSVWYKSPYVMHNRNILINGAFPSHLLEKIGLTRDRFVAPEYGVLKRSTYLCPATARGTLRVKKYPGIKIGNLLLSDASILSMQIPMEVVALENKHPGRGIYDPICAIPKALAPFVYQVAPGLCLHAARDCHGRAEDASIRFKESLGFQGECYCAMNCGSKWGKLLTEGNSVVDALDAQEYVLDGTDDGLSDHARTAIDNAWGSAGMAGPAFGRQSYVRKEWEHENRVIRILCVRCNMKRTNVSGGAPGTSGSRPRSKKGKS